MRTSTSKAALVALATAAFALPAFAQTSNDDATRPPAATMSPSNPAPAPSAEMKQDQSASPSAQSDVNKDNSVAAAPDMGAAADAGGHRVSRIIGTAVVNDKDESIGKVDDILIGPNDKATMAVISVGGFLGIGAKLVAVPFDQLQPAANDKKSLTLPNASKEQLQSMPAFKYGRGA